MIEQWLEELGVTIQYSIHDHFGWMRGYEGRANTPELLFQYTWDGVYISWRETFDRWSVSTDWRCDFPTSKVHPAYVLTECVRRGRAGDIPSMRTDAAYPDRIEFNE